MTGLPKIPDVVSFLGVSPTPVLGGDDLSVLAGGTEPLPY